LSTSFYFSFFVVQTKTF